MSDSNSFEEITKLFQDEIGNFEKMILEMPNNIESLSIAEIIQCYYKVMNISSMIKVLKKSQNIEQNKEDVSKQITNVEKQIHEEFDHKIHPAIMSHITESINQQMTSLRESKKTEERTKEIIETEAKLFEKLRETMSTKEFVEQYNKELNHD